MILATIPSTEGGWTFGFRRHDIGVALIVPG